MKNKVYTWKEFDKDMLSISKIIKGYKKGLVKNLYGYDNGGMVMAVKLSSLTGIPILREKSKISKGTVVLIGLDLLHILDINSYFSLVALFSPDKFAGLHETKLKVTFPWNK